MELEIQLSNIDTTRRISVLNKTPERDLEEFKDQNPVQNSASTLNENSQTHDKKVLRLLLNNSSYDMDVQN